jgi:hypothetical protein
VTVGPAWMALESEEGDLALPGLPLPGLLHVETVDLRESLIDGPGRRSEPRSWRLLADPGPPPDPLWPL